MLSKSDVSASRLPKVVVEIWEGFQIGRSSEIPQVQPLLGESW